MSRPRRARRPRRIAVNAAAWTQVALDDSTTVGAGLNIPTAIQLQQPLRLDPGSYGMAFVLFGDADHDFTIGDGSNQSHSDAHLALTLGSATNVPFSGRFMSPGVWNGSICLLIGTL